jgi:thiol-disulfide isomerase/thioredoxin
MTSYSEIYLLPPVIYLEPKDFKDNLNLKSFKNKICVVMVQANYCGYCTSAKSDFQQFAKSNKNVVCLTMQCDEKNNGELLLQIVKQLKPEFAGFPDYFLFKNKKFIKKEIEGRDVPSLENFAKE